MIRTTLLGAIPTSLAIAAALTACRGGASFSEVSATVDRPRAHGHDGDEHQSTALADSHGGSHDRAAAEEAESPVDPAKAPRAVVASTEHDFGEVEQGEKVRHVFKVRNTGKGVLHIKKVRGS